MNSELLVIGVQNGGHISDDGKHWVEVYWCWSEGLTLPKLLDRMVYLLNSGTYRAEVGLPNAIKIRRELDHDQL